jgi:hypothetical protein
MIGGGACSRFKGGVRARKTAKWAEAGLAGFSSILGVPPNFRGKFKNCKHWLNRNELSRFLPNWARFVRVCYLDHSFGSEIGAK